MYAEMTLKRGDCGREHQVNQFSGNSNPPGRARVAAAKNVRVQSGNVRPHDVGRATRSGTLKSMPSSGPVQMIFHPVRI